MVVQWFFEPDQDLVGVHAEPVLRHGSQTEGGDDRVRLEGAQSAKAASS